MRKCNVLAGAALVALLSGALAPLASAADEEKVVNGVNYACAGVGYESQHDPRWSAYPAKLVFAGGNGDYLSDVAVTIETTQGQQVLETTCDGPWMLLNLPPDKYRIGAVAKNNYREEFTLNVGHQGQVEKIVRFPQVMN